MRKKAINVNICEEEYLLLKVIAESQYRTVTSLVYMLIREYMKTNGSQTGD